MIISYLNGGVNKEKILMSNLEQGLENNIELLNKATNKSQFLKIYGNLRVLEEKAFNENDRIVYKIQEFILKLEKFILQ
jgi:hypothetical protein